MPSKRRTAAPVGRDGISSMRGRDQEIQQVELDATLAKTLGLSEGQRIKATLHFDSPKAHTINIEPLTPDDWEIIELHATFLELNLIHQVRALPNPACKSADGSPVPPHPLTLHLSPTSSANIKVISVDPSPGESFPFSRISPDAEVIVAPKTRPKSSQSTGDHRSVASTSKSKRSGASTIRRRSAREEPKPTLFLRGVDRTACADWFDEEVMLEDFSVWVDRDLLFSNAFRGVNYVVVDVIKPAGLQQPRAEDGSGPAAASQASSKIIAHLRPWDDPPNSQTVALSPPLCATLGCTGMVGGVVKLQAASQQLPRGTVQGVKVFPFATSSRASEGLRFGGESKAEKEESAKRFRQIYQASKGPEGLLQGPLTDGTVMGIHEGLEAPQGWEGGILKFTFSSDFAAQEQNMSAVNWMLGLDAKTPIEFQQPVPRPSWLSDNDGFDVQPSNDSLLVGIDTLLQNLQSQLAHLSSALLTGAMGSGKTCVAKHLAQVLREDTLFYTSYFPCRKLVNDETRISTIKETLNRIFMSASWGARLNGRALVILDDLDKLCPVETELQVGNDNGRSRQVSEIICSIVRQYCNRDSGVVLLATAEGKESLNNVVVSGHVVREIVELKAPDKEARRRVMESLAKKGAVPADDAVADVSDVSRPQTSDGSIGEDSGAWMDGTSQGSREYSPAKASGFILDSDLDFLDIAGSTDGYMPGDLTVFVSRARNEAIMRAIAESSGSDSDAIHLSRVDFDKALKGFTPASLRNVSLQSSSTSFKSIGGLQETRKVLLETLQYPTKYAPIFAQCPLRLRSGLLLYGFPGCGKTLLASAVAGECGLNFISVKGPEILNKYIGASEKSVRDLFDRAQAAKPCVLFFDEFDSIAPKRGHDSTGVTDRVVNQLLTQMDGAEGLSGVYVLAATSRPDLIDPALLRPGRLDKSLLCDMPALEDRVDILKALFQKVRLSSELTDSDEALTEVAHKTEGFSGADLQALVSNAQLEAIHDVLDVDGPIVTSKRTNGLGSHKANTTPSFVQFQYGGGNGGAEANGISHPTPQSRSATLVEQAAILSKLDEIKLARKKSRQAHGQLPAPESKAAAPVDQREVVIDVDHLWKALDNTRASISSEERSRLQRIYHEFVVGRSGQMKDGQGSMEIGGRSSLM